MLNYEPFWVTWRVLSWFKTPTTCCNPSGSYFFQSVFPLYPKISHKTLLWRVFFSFVEIHRSYTSVHSNLLRCHECFRGFYCVECLKNLVLAWVIFRVKFCRVLFFFQRFEVGGFIRAPWRFCFGMIDGIGVVRFPTCSFSWWVVVLSLNIEISVILRFFFCACWWLSCILNGFLLMVGFLVVMTWVVFFVVVLGGIKV